MSRYILLRRPFLDSFWIRFWLYPNLGPNMLISRWFSHIFWRIGFLKFASIWGPCWSQHGPILHPKIDPNLLQESSQNFLLRNFSIQVGPILSPSWDQNGLPRPPLGRLVHADPSLLPLGPPHQPLDLPDPNLEPSALSPTQLGP